MSSSQQTTNLGLPIYGDSDVPSWKDTNTPFQTLDDIIGQGGTGDGSQVQLDFANPLHVFSTGNLSYTATKVCYLCGVLDGGSSASCNISIDGTIIAANWNAEHRYFIAPLRIEKGSTITTLIAQNNLKVFSGSVVSSEVTIYNEAEVELNYTTPLHDFSTATSYTCVKKCWLVGTLSVTTGLTINGKAYGIANTNNGSIQIFLPLSQGDVVSVTDTLAYLKVLEGAVSGSVGQIGSGLPDLDYSTPLATLTSNNKTYTCTKPCYMIGTIITDGGDVTVTINGTQVCRCSGVTTVFTDVPLLKLKRGDVVALSANAGASQINILDII